jgi:hypothetical protein
MEPSEKKIGKNFADFVDRRYKPEKPMIFKIFYLAVYEGLSWLLVLNTTAMIAYKIFIAIRLIVNYLLLYL